MTARPVRGARRRRRPLARLGAVAVLAALAGPAFSGLPLAPAEAGAMPLAAGAAEWRLDPATGGTPPPPVELTIATSGDILPHWPVLGAAYDASRGPYDFRPLFAPIRPLVRGADLAICHAETPIGAGAVTTYPRFNAPPALADAIRWTGWDACTTASNHAVDKGALGLATTLRELRRAGVRATGTARTRAERRRILFLRAGGIRVALLSYTYGTNGLPLPHPWSVNLLSRKRVVADAARARRAGADLVLASFHWGTEYVHKPSADQRGLARSLLRSGVVDAIVGHHAHVVQPVRRIGGRFVVYGMGNLLSAQSAACCPAGTQDGIVALLRVRVSAGEATVRRVDYVPTRVRRPDYAVEPVGSALRRLGRRGEGAGEAAAALRRSYRETVVHAGRGARVGPLPRRLPR